MNIYEAEEIEESLKTLKSLSGTSAKVEFAVKTFTQGHHYEFLDLVGNDDRQWFVSWDSVMGSKPVVSGMGLDEILFSAENRISTPTQTSIRLHGLLEEGWPELVIRAIVNKTLDAGITVSSIRKAQGKSPRKFLPSLCADWLKIPESKKSKILTENRYVSTPKMDGLRCLFLLNMPNEGVYSRSMKPLKNLGKHLDSLKKQFGEPCVIDGEALSASNDWADTITGAKKTGAKTDMHFYPFDYIPGQEFIDNQYTTTSEVRHARLMKGVDMLPESMFRIVERSEVLRTPDQVHEEHALCVGQGWEGAVLHNLDAPYSCKRTRAWIKVKSFFSVDMRCIGFFEGTGKHLGRLGGIKVEGTYGSRTIRSEVGTGFSDQERELIWSNPQGFLGKTAEIKVFEVTKDNSLRFPSFLRWL